MLMCAAAQMVDYNVPLGKLNRGAAAVQCYLSIAKARGSTITEQSTKQAVVAGWCIELVSAGGRFWHCSCVSPL